MIDGKTKRMTEKRKRHPQVFVRPRNRVIRREDMLKELWGENDYFWAEPGRVHHQNTQVPEGRPGLTRGKRVRRGIHF